MSPTVYARVPTLEQSTRSRRSHGPSAPETAEVSAAESAEPVAEAAGREPAAPRSAATAPAMRVPAESIGPAIAGVAAVPSLRPGIGPGAGTIPPAAAEARRAALCLRPRLLLLVGPVRVA